KTSVLEYLAKKPRESLLERHWRWVEFAWEKDTKELERFAPTSKSKSEFPWATYVEKLAQNDQGEKILSILPQISDERLKEHWIQIKLVEKLDPRIFTAIQSLQTEFQKNSLLADWYERQGDMDR